MILTISHYMEALGSPDGRMRTLRRLAPVRGDDGVPVFSMPGHGLVDFEVTVDGKPCTLRCPLVWGGQTAERLRAPVEKDRGLGGRFFTEWRVLESEIMLFGADGGRFEADVLVRPAPAGEALADFLEKAALREDTEALDAARRSFEELVRWADRVGRSGISPRKIRVGPDGALFLTGFSATDRRRRVEEMFCAASTPEGPAPVPPAGCEEWVWDGRPGLATMMTGGRWELAARDGRTLTTGPYDWLGEWSEGLLLAQRGGKCGFLDTSGREAIPCIYDDASSFSEGRALVTFGDRQFFIDPRGNEI
jgi:hypothetical protein